MWAVKQPGTETSHLAQGVTEDVSRGSRRVASQKLAQSWGGLERVRGFAPVALGYHPGRSTKVAARVMGGRAVRLNVAARSAGSLQDELDCITSVQQACA